MRKLLEENTVKRFMKLANIEPLTEGFAAKLQEEDDEEGDMPPMDDMGDDAGDEAAEEPMDDMGDMDMDAEGGEAKVDMPEEQVLDLVETLKCLTSQKAKSLWIWMLVMMPGVTMKFLMRWTTCEMKIRWKKLFFASFADSVSTKLAAVLLAPALVVEATEHEHSMRADAEHAVDLCDSPKHV
jgi:hypothetical protein